MSLYVYMDKYVYICILYIINTCRCVLFYIYIYDPNPHKP